VGQRLLTAVGTAVGEARSELEAADEEILQLSKIQEARALLPAATEPPAAKVEPSARGTMTDAARPGLEAGAEFLADGRSDDREHWPFD
jgi:hypothetical protein